MSAIAARLRDSVYTWGLILLVISLIIFCIPFITGSSANGGAPIFLLNYVLVAFYFFTLLFSGSLKRGRNGLHSLVLLLLLFLVSAYALNREMSVFQNSAPWFCGVLVALGLNYILFAYFDSFRHWVKHTLSFLLGISMPVFVYLSLYLLPYYAISIAGFFALGISLHTFVPLLFVIYSIVLIRRAAVGDSKLYRSFFAGIGLVLLLVTAYVIWWSTIIHTVNRQYQKELVGQNEALPAWVRVARTIPKNSLAEKVLKTNLVYGVSSISGSFFRMPNRNFGEEQLHDPLVMISSFFAGETQLSDEEKIKILQSVYDARHEAEERLWSGEDLKTAQVNTTVNIWPQHRMSYTEKVITVTNHRQTSWSSQEEAIYTFYLPEGGVVTSLSLWINGREEKAILTTKEKATEAYTTIVGVEQRDPSVVHWQEGNRVSVRVFPVVAGKSRIFKLGVTAPLNSKNGKLSYDNIHFDGPSIADAKELVKVEFFSKAKVEVPDAFDASTDFVYQKEGSYDAAWQISCAEEPLSNTTFTFEGSQYSTALYLPNRQPAIIRDVYLDVNAAWTEEEYRQVFALVKNHRVFAYDGSLQTVEDANSITVYNRLKQHRFSLFPFYVIANPGQSLVITKSDGNAPNMEDLNDTEFLRKLKASASGEKIKLFNLDGPLSSYLSSLKEMRWFDYETGTVKVLNEIMTDRVFAAGEENNDKVIIHNANIALVKTAGNAVASSAPDHLMRLFSYNHILQQMGTHRLSDTTINSALVQEAKKAYIVTPLSSLVVLETQADYERFNIEDSQHSLKNASANGNGSVPEPHEWALIIIALLMMIYFKYPLLFRRLISKA